MDLSTLRSLKLLPLQEFYPDQQFPFAIVNKVSQKLQNDKEGQKAFIYGLFKQKFKPHITKTNCSSNLHPENSRKFYTCGSCNIGLGCTRFCEKCWDVTKHTNHIFRLRDDYDDQNFQCGCGLPNLLSKQSFCHQHQTYDQLIPCEVKEPQLVLFKRTFILFMEFALSNGQNKFLYKILRELCCLNQNSVYYNRMTCQTISQKSVKGQIFLVRIAKTQNYQTMLRLLGLMRCDLQTGVQLSKHIAQNAQKFINAEQIGRYRYKQILSTVLDSTVASRLITQKYYNSSFIQFISSGSIEDNIDKNALYMLQIQKSNLSELAQYFSERKKLAENVKKALLAKIINGSILNLDHVWGDPNLTQTLSSLFFQHIWSQRESIIEKHFDMQKLENIFVRTIFANQIQILSKIKTVDQINLIRFFILMTMMPSSSKLIDLFWKRLLTNETGPLPIDQAVSRFYRVVSIIADLDFLASEQIVKFNKKYKKTSDDVNHLNQVFKLHFEKLLVKNKSLNSEEIQQLKNKGQLDFNVEEVLQKYCDYNFQDETFNLKKSYVCENVLLKLSINIRHENIDQMYNSTLRLHQKCEFPQGFQSPKYLKLVLNRVLIELLDASWNQTSQSQELKKNQNKSGYLYLFALVLYDGLTHGGDAELRQRLESLRSHQDTLNKFAQSLKEKQMILRLFGLNYQQQQLEKVQKTQEDANSQMNNCWVCNFFETQSNTFVRLAELKNSENSIVTSVYGKENCPGGISFKTCTHFVHLGCFEKILKSGYEMSFACQVCDMRANCCIPVHYKPENHKANKAIRNILIATSVSELGEYRVKDEFALILSHLISSNGLNNFIQPELTSKNTSKDSQFLIWIQLLFKRADGLKQKSYLSEIASVRQQINWIPRDDCRLVQLLILNLIETLIMDPPAKMKVLEQLKSDLQANLRDKELRILEKRISSLIGEPVNFQSSTKQESQSQLIFYFKLPIFKNAVEVHTFFKPQKCVVCNSDSSYKKTMCLVCNSITCKDCYQIHCQQKHEAKKCIALSSQRQVSFLINQKFADFPVYRNKLMKPLVVSYSHEEQPEENFVFVEQAFKYAIDKCVNS